VVGFFDVGILADFCRTQVLHVQEYAYVVGNPAIDFDRKIAKKGEVVCTVRSSHLHTKNMEQQEDDNSVSAESAPDVLADIRDGVVAERTLISYINDNLAFLQWCIDKSDEYDCLTDDGRQALQNMRTHRANEPTRAFNARVRMEFKVLLHNAHVNPIVFVDQISPEWYMHFLLSLHHPLHGD